MWMVYFGIVAGYFAIGHMLNTVTTKRVTKGLGERFGEDGDLVVQLILACVVEPKGSFHPIKTKNKKLYRATGRFFITLCWPKSVYWNLRGYRDAIKLGDSIVEDRRREEATNQLKP